MWHSDRRMYGMACGLEGDVANTCCDRGRCEAVPTVRWRLLCMSKNGISSSCDLANGRSYRALCLLHMRRASCRACLGASGRPNVGSSVACFPSCLGQPGPDATMYFAKEVTKAETFVDGTWKNRNSVTMGRLGVCSYAAYWTVPTRHNTVVLCFDSRGSCVLRAPDPYCVAPTTSRPQYTS